MLAAAFSSVPMLGPTIVEADDGCSAFLGSKLFNYPPPFITGERKT